LIGVTLASFFYIKTRKVAKLAYQKSSIRLLGRDENNLPKEVTVHFQGKNVERLTKTTLILWNNGTEVLKGEQVVDKAPIKISFFRQDQILSCKIVKSTNEHNDLSASKDEANPHQSIIRFRYLNPKDGGVLELLHDSKEQDPTIEGEIMGVPKGFEDLGQYGYGNWMFDRIYLLDGVMMILSITMIAMVLSFPLTEETLKLDHIDVANSFFRLILFCLGLVYGISSAVSLLARRRKYPKSLEIEK